MTDAFRVPPQDLTHTCDPATLGFETTADIAPIHGTVGQERAVAAIDFGLDIKTYGFNLYVAVRARAVTQAFWPTSQPRPRTNPRPTTGAT